MPPVARTSDGQMEDVRPPRVVEIEVPTSRSSRELVGPQERRVAHARALADAALHELVEGSAGRALGDEREHDVAAVAVGEALTGRELRWVAVEDGEVVLRRRELVHRDGHQILVEIEVVLLVEVITDPRAMCE